MSRDYAKQPPRYNRARSSRWWRDLFVILVALCFIGFSGTMYYFHKIHANNATSAVVLMNKIKLWFHKTTPPSSTLLKQQAKQTNPVDEIHFDFYDALPTLQVTATSSSSNNKVDIETSTVEGPPKYFLYLVSDKDEGLMREKRVSLLLAGVDAEMMRVGDSYRLQKGPYISANQAKSMQKELEKKGIISRLVKL